MYDVNVRFVTDRGVELGSLMFNPYIPHKEGDVVIHDGETYVVTKYWQATNIDKEKNTVFVNCAPCEIDDTSAKYFQTSGIV